MDRLLRESNPPAGQLASPKPQYKKPGEDTYEPVEGQYGAPFAILKNASGQVISPATDAKLEQVKSELELIKSELQTIKANQLSGDQKVQLPGIIVEYELAVNAESLPPGDSRIINWNITDEDLILVAVNINKAPWSLMGRSMFYTQSDSNSSAFFPERKQVQTTFPATALPAVSMFLGYVPHDEINSWGEAIEFPKIYRGYGSRNDFRVRNYSDEIATVTVRIVRVWNA